MGGNQKDQRVSPAEGQTRPPEAVEAPLLGQRKADLGMEMREQQADRLVRERREAMALLDLDLEGDLEGQKDNIEDFKEVIPSILGALIAKGALKLTDIRDLGAFSSLDVQTTNEVQKKALQILKTIADNQEGDVAGEIVKSWHSLLNDISVTVTVFEGAISEITGRKPKDGLDKDIVSDTRNFMQQHPLITLGLAAAGVYLGYKLITSICDIGEGESTTDKIWKWGTRAILIAGGILVAGQVLGIDAVRGWLKEKGLNVDENRIVKALILFSNFRVRDGMLTLFEGVDPEFDLHESIGKKAASEPYVVRMVGKTSYQDFMHRSPSQSVFSDMPVLGKLFSDTLDQEKRLRGLLQMNEARLTQMKPAPRTVDDAFEFLEKQGLAGISGLSAQDLAKADKLREEKDQQVAVIERDKTLTEEQKAFYLKRIEEFRDKFDNIEDESRSYLDELKRSLSLAMDEQFGDIPDSNDLAAMKGAVIEAVRAQSLATDAAMVDQIFAFLDNFEETVDQSTGKKLTTEQVTDLVDKINRFHNLYIALNIKGPTYERGHRAELQSDIEGTRSTGFAPEWKEAGKDVLDWGDLGYKTYLGVPLKVKMDMEEGRLFSAAVIGVPSAIGALVWVLEGDWTLARKTGRVLTAPVMGPLKAVTKTVQLSAKSTPFVAGKLFDINVGNSMKNFMADRISFVEFEEVASQRAGLIRRMGQPARVALSEYSGEIKRFDLNDIVRSLRGGDKAPANSKEIIEALFKEKYKFLKRNIPFFHYGEIFTKITGNTELQRFLLLHNRDKFVHRFMPRIVTGHPIAGDTKLLAEFVEAVNDVKANPGLLQTLETSCDRKLMKLLGKEPKIFGQLVTPEGKALIQSLNGNKEFMDALLKDRPFRKAFLLDPAKRLSLIDLGYTEARKTLVSDGTLKEGRVGRALRGVSEKASGALDSFGASIASRVDQVPDPFRTEGTGDARTYHYKFNREPISLTEAQISAKVTELSSTAGAGTTPEALRTQAVKALLEEKFLTPVEVKPNTYRFQGQEFKFAPGEIDAKLTGAAKIEAIKTLCYERVVRGLEITDAKIVDGKYQYKIGGKWIEPLDSQTPAKLADVRAKFVAGLQQEGISLDFQKFAAESKALIYFPVVEKMIGTAAAVLMIYHLETATDKRKAVAETAAGLGSFLAGMKLTDWYIGKRIGVPTTPGKLVARTVIDVMGGIAASFGFSEPIGKIVEHYFKEVPGSHAASGEVIEIFEKMTALSTVRLVTRSAQKRTIKKLLVKGELEGVTAVFEKKITKEFLKKIVKMAAKKEFMQILKALGPKGIAAAATLADSAIPVIGWLDEPILVALVLWSAYDIYEIVTLVANAATVQEEMEKRKSKRMTSFRIMTPESRRAIQAKLKPGQIVDNIHEELGEQALFDLLGSLPDTTAVEIKREGIPGREIWYLKKSEAVGITIFDEKGEEIAKISDEDAEELDAALANMEKGGEPEAPPEQGRKEAA